MADVEWRGLAELKRTLNALPVELETTAVRASLRAGARVLKEGVQMRAPRDTGVGVENVIVNVRKDATFGFKAVVGFAKKAFYMAFQEWGTRFMPAKGFMRRTVDEDGQLAVAAFVAEADRGVERAVKKLAKGVK